MGFWRRGSQRRHFIFLLLLSHREPELRFLNFNFLLFEQSALSRHMVTSNKQPAGNVGTILQASYISETVKETMHDEISIALDQKKNHSLRKCTQRVRPLQLCHALAFSNSICYTSIWTSQELRMLSRSPHYIQKTKLIKRFYLPVDKTLLSTKEI